MHGRITKPVSAPMAGACPPPSHTHTHHWAYLVRPEGAVWVQPLPVRRVVVQVALLPRLAGGVVPEHALVHLRWGRGSGRVRYEGYGMRGGVGVSNRCKGRLKRR